jgi:serine/threonine protein kinase
VEACHDVKPQRFGRYILLDRIGEGGMAEVFRAVMPGAEGFKRTFVVKRILTQFSRSDHFVNMFVREARIVALMHHPNIVQVYDFGNENGYYYLAMEYLRGNDVHAIFHRLRGMQCPFPIPVAAFIAHEVANALAYAHALTDPDGHPLDIVHRDVSPSNVMCLREGGVKLLDFGVARAVTEEVLENTEEGNFKGKLAYMAPERLLHASFDGRADLYSLGVMFWEMLTCKRLFQGKDDIETFQRARDMFVDPPSLKNPDVPKCLNDIVMRMLERDPDDRYVSGRAVAEDLDEFLHRTKFSSRTIPDLLTDLFGSRSHSSRFTMTCLTPELLAEVNAMESPKAGNGLMVAQVSVPEPPKSANGLETTDVIGKGYRRSWRLWAAAGAFITIAVFMFGLGFRANRVEPSASARPAMPVLPVPTPQPTQPTAATTSPSSPIATVLADPSATKPKKAPTGQRSEKLRVQKVNNPIADGDSIDPFAEAAERIRR